MSPVVRGGAGAGHGGAPGAEVPSIAHGDSVVLAHVRRGGLVESVHHGHALVTTIPGDAGPPGSPGIPGSRMVLRAGREIEFYPRSAAKPFQALAMLRAGARLTDEQLALACASHAGLAEHQRVALSTLHSVGLGAADLQNTPDRPLDPEAARSAPEPTQLAQNCSGKHAAMLATCVAAGWDTAGYLDPAHPLQRRIMATLAEITGVIPRESVDGCGAPTPTSTLAGMGLALQRLLTAPEGTHERRIVDVMRRHPELISGPGRLDTQAMAAVPGLVVKGGAEGVLLAGLAPDTDSDGASIVIKIADGDPRALPVLLADALRLVGRVPQPAGAQVDDLPVDGGRAMGGGWEWTSVPVLGHGRPVGEIVSVLAAASGRSTGSTAVPSARRGS